ncbi:uncharacterized protein LOC119093496 [Pollicipes pollicipes]|uniref:uncharacterized protein LOC119093496 n=1 Tax=Pollicipes pollicipes TaxID=41117 RepID=UPI001884E737|nr:uncharacterized protein LOC119093496 [Pollicipes pollicipes]
MSSYSYKVTRETISPRGGGYTTTSYSTPTAYSPAGSYLRSVPTVAHQRLTPVSVPAYSSPAMPYYLWEPEDVVVLPRRRTLARLSDELDDDPVLKWYEDRIHHAQAEAIANANKRISDLCTPRPRHISVVPPYTPKRYKEPVSSQYKYSKYRPPITEDMKPIRRNIEIKSRFDKAQSAAQNDYKRMGSGHLACVSLLGGRVVSKRPHSRFYSGERARSQDMAARLLPLAARRPGPLAPENSPAAHIRHSGGVSDGRHWRAAAPEEGRVGGPGAHSPRHGRQKGHRSRRWTADLGAVEEDSGVSCPRLGGDEEYYELSPEPEFERDASPYLSSEAEPIPDLEPTMESPPQKRSMSQR